MKLKPQTNLYNDMRIFVDIQFKEELSLKLKRNLVLLKKTIFTTILLFFLKIFPDLPMKNASIQLWPVNRMHQGGE